MRRSSIDRPPERRPPRHWVNGGSVARRQESAHAAAPGTPVGEMTYRRVRADIVYGRLAPGQKLTLDRMRDAYGSAVSTLREIFNGLASEGLITAEGARGFEVASISPDNLREIAAHAPASRMRRVAKLVRGRRRGVGGTRRCGAPQAGVTGAARGRRGPICKRRPCGDTIGNFTTRSFPPAARAFFLRCTRASMTSICATSCLRPYFAESRSWRSIASCWPLPWNVIGAEPRRRRSRTFRTVSRRWCPETGGVTEARAGMQSDPRCARNQRSYGGIVRSGRS